eukprot:scaffold7092_cov262-Pinguiococcus_pyrenoidosus.AAC.20
MSAPNGARFLLSGASVDFRARALDRLSIFLRSRMMRSVGVVALVAAVNAEVYLKETFNDDAWESRWIVPSDWKSASELGKWTQTAGLWYGDEADKGLQTGPDARFFGLSSKLETPFDNKDKDLVISYTVKHEQKIDCGGAYIKLLPQMDQASFGGDTEYSIMFGPDICGSGTKKTHVIFHYPPKDENLLIKNDIKCETDQLSHMYTLKVSPDNTYEVFIDKKSVKSGNLKDDWDFLLSEEIKDPNVSKPEDWVDEKKIPDPEDVKPEGYDDIPAEIPDPEAEKPDDWSDEEDGEWEPPMVDNPEYKGPWKPKMIANPDYKGPVRARDHATEKALDDRVR